MQHNILGRTGIKVTELCIGTLIHGRLQSNLSSAAGALAIRYAFDSGVNFVDTAKTYGTYSHIRQAVGDRSDIIIASKSASSSSKEMRFDIESCLRELNRKVIDIFHLHLIRSQDDINARDGALDALVKCRQEGLIRAVGASAHGVNGVKAILSRNEIDVLLPIVNYKGLGITDGSLEEMLEQVRLAQKKGLGVYDMKPLGGGHLIGDIPNAIDYVRKLGVFHSISVGLKTPDEVEIMTGLFKGDRSAVERARLIAKRGFRNKHLVVYDICERCGRCTEACAQNAITIGENKAKVDHSRCILCGYCAGVCPKFAIRVI